MVLSKLSKPTNDFGLRFLEHLASATENENVLFSPLSVLLAYGMLLEGATGQTEQQIKEVLQLTLLGNDTSEIASASKKLLEDYKLVMDGSSDRKFSLAIGNLAMVNKDAKLKEAYAESLLNNYFALATNEDFENGIAAMNKLNSWISEKTFGKITNILPYPPNRETMLMLVNTLYFKGKWVETFKKDDTINFDFTNSDGTKSKIKSMTFRHKIFNYAHKKEDKLKIIDLPYKGDVSMIFILPTESNIVPSLNSTEINDLMSSMSETKLDVVKIPKFKLEDTHNLHKILPRMGMTLPFSSQAQLPNIAEGLKLQVSQSVQKALIEVDEEGTVAAAVTIVNSERTCMSAAFRPEPKVFIIDRPFLFMIRDNLTGINLFMGQMNKMPNIVSSTQSPISSKVDHQPTIKRQTQRPVL